MRRILRRNQKRFSRMPLKRILRKSKLQRRNKKESI